MKFKRLFSTYEVKGTEKYLDSQRKYEIARTIIFFALSVAIFIMGYLSTKTRNNLLTIVAVLGCLPASKSLVIAIMFCKYKSLSPANSSIIKKIQNNDLYCLYDMILTTREKTFPILHITIHNQNIIGFTEQEKLSEAACEEHIKTALKVDHYLDQTVKIYKDINKYTERMEQLKTLPDNEDRNKGIANTLKSIAL